MSKTIDQKETKRPRYDNRQPNNRKKEKKSLKYSCDERKLDDVNNESKLIEID